MLLLKHLVGIFHSTYMLGGYSERFSNLVTLRAYRCKNQWFFRLHPRGLQWDTHMKCKRQIKLTSAMILRFVALSVSSLPKDSLFPCKISACRWISSRPHVGDVGVAPGTKVVLPGVSTG